MGDGFSCFGLGRIGDINFVDMAFLEGMARNRKYVYYVSDATNLYVVVGISQIVNALALFRTFRHFHRLPVYPFGMS